MRPCPEVPGAPGCPPGCACARCSGAPRAATSAQPPHDLSLTSPQPQPDLSPISAPHPDLSVTLPRPQPDLQPDLSLTSPSPTWSSTQQPQTLPRAAWDGMFWGRGCCRPERCASRWETLGPRVTPCPVMPSAPEGPSLSQEGGSPGKDGAPLLQVLLGSAGLRGQCHRHAGKRRPRTRGWEACLCCGPQSSHCQWSTLCKPLPGGPTP